MPFSQSPACTDAPLTKVALATRAFESLFSTLGRLDRMRDVLVTGGNGAEEALEKPPPSQWPESIVDLVNQVPSLCVKCDAVISKVVAELTEALIN